MLAQAEAMKAEAKDFDPVKAMKEIADLLTPLGDGIRVVTGQDPITGEKLSGSERGLSLIYIIPLAKVGKYGVKGFKFVAEGMEDLNKLNKKADKVKEAEKSTKKASGADKLLKQDLLDELSKSDAKYNPDDVVMVTKNTEKDLLWLEYGNNKAGLNHIEVRHANDFSKRGINNIPEFIYDMLKNKPISIVESSRGLNATYLVNGKKYLIAYGKNGFIVSVYPI
ncbi:pre-toxin TG domain-containing protein [Listeria seeligeri]|uniref:pre-toxin TG domain-containing protein n=1 Tax=Listeria seeligeri TaxID=1640 RepID=UPI0022EC0E09|nr:pre-toxin TG domain-containing protein [Listeria seeligeri]